MTKRLCISMLAIVLSGCSLIPSEHIVNYETQPCLIPNKDDVFSLCKKFLFKIDDRKYEIKKGFRTDLASIPRILWTFKSPMDFEHIAPAVIHDYFYRCSTWNNRKYADDVFYYLLLHGGVGKADALKFYLSVRVFGADYFSPTDC